MCGLPSFEVLEGILSGPIALREVTCISMSIGVTYTQIILKIPYETFLRIIQYQFHLVPLGDWFWFDPVGEPQLEVSLACHIISCLF